MGKPTLKKIYKRRNKRQHKTHNKTHNKRHNKRHNKTHNKLIKKGGDITYLSTPGADYIFGLKQPTKNLICSNDNTVCLAVGEESEQVKTFFDGFVKFNFARKVIKRIGTPSVNGFVFEIKNETKGHIAYSVLKSSQETTSDNLMYEYNVGLYLNKVNRFYPCFVETYGLFAYRTEAYWNLFKDTKKIDNLHALQEALVQLPLDYAIGCQKSKHLAILIQHLPSPKTLDELTDDTIFIKDELIYALFQLYIPLARLMSNFTHYDLHLGNILMYEPIKGKYIEYHYHNTPTFDISDKPTRTTQTAYESSMKLETIVFKSSYLLKIIDYGRSFFYDDERNNSKAVYSEICKTAECNYETNDGIITCGANYGLSWLENNSKNLEGSHFISSQKANISHDLLPLERLYQKFIDDKKKQGQLLPELFKDLFENLLSRVIYEGDFGTFQERKTGYSVSRILNVQDAATIISKFVKKPYNIAHNNRVNSGKTKIGELHIFMDGSRPMEFIPFYGMEE
jgi:hypothetical protein